MNSTLSKVDPVKKLDNQNANPIRKSIKSDRRIIYSLVVHSIKKRLSVLQMAHRSALLVDSRAPMEAT